MTSNEGRVKAPPQPSTVLRGHCDAVNSLCFIKLNNVNDNPLHLISGSSDGHINIWNIENRRIVKSFLAHSHSVLSVQYHHSSNRVITFGRDGLLKIWDIESMYSVNDIDQMQALESYHTGSFQFCNASCNKYSDDDNELCDLVITPSSNDGEILIWDIRTKNVVSTIKSDSYGRNVGMVTSLLLQSTTRKCDDDTFSSDMNLLAGYEDGSLSNIDIRQMKPISNISLNQSPILAVDITNDGKYIIAAGADKDVHQLRLNTSSGDINTNKSFTLPNSGTGSLKFRKDGRIFGSAHWDNTVRIYQSKIKPLAVLRYHRESVFAIEFANYDGCSHIFATGSKDKTIAIWDNLYE